MLYTTLVLEYVEALLTLFGPYNSGDIVKVTPGVAHFDMAILQSQRLLVDESALTGEVHPVAKIPFDPSSSDGVYNSKLFKSSTVSAGTTVIECSEGEGLEGVLAIVTETGSFTTKGELLSDVLSCKSLHFLYDSLVLQPHIHLRFRFFLHQMNVTSSNLIPK